MALQLEEDWEFQRRAWIVQRIGWVAIGGVVVACLLGVFGGGPLSQVSAQGSTLGLEYQRFARIGQATRIRFTVQSAPAARLDISRAYLDSFRIERITPQPADTKAAGDWVSYSFGGEAPVSVTFHLIPEEYGAIRGSTRAAGETMLFRQFVYP